MVNGAITIAAQIAWGSHGFFWRLVGDPEDVGGVCVADMDQSYAENLMPKSKVTVHPAVGRSTRDAFWPIDSSEATPVHPEQTA